MIRDHATFVQWDASYVLGALTPGDRRDYEAHLEECERCRAAVGELASMPGLLARARPVADLRDDAQEDAPPANLVELVVHREVRRRRTVRNRIIGGVAGIAAAIGLAIAVPIALTHPAVPDTTVPDTTVPETTVALAAVADSTMTATIGFSPVAWGTRIDMTCDYPVGSTWNDAYGPLSYQLVVTDLAGNVSQVSTWNAVPGKTIHLDAATAVPLSQIASVEVRSGSGVTILAAAISE